MQCPICDSKQSKLVNVFNEYKLYRCLNCEVIFCDPFKNPGACFYEIFYQDLDSHNPDRFNINSSQKLFLKRNKKGRILDIACGMGIFLNSLKKKGFEVVGIDFDKVSLSVCRRKFNIQEVYNYDILGKEIF